MSQATQRAAIGTRNVGGEAADRLRSRALDGGDGGGGGGGRISCSGLLIMSSLSTQMTTLAVSCLVTSSPLAQVVTIRGGLP